MLSFERDGRRFNHRVVGVALHEGRVLLHRAEHDDFWALPGGRVEFMEPSAEALHREMQEELGVEVQVERLLWVLENFFVYRATEFHEVGLYYLMRLPPASPLLRVEGDFYGTEGDLTLIFRWFPLDTLETLPLYPTFLRDALLALPEQIIHLVHRDA